MVGICPWKGNVIIMQNGTTYVPQEKYEKILKKQENGEDLSIQDIFLPVNNDEQ